MEWKNTIFALICGAVALVGAISIMYQIYKMTVIDAKARGLKHPKLWGLLATNGNNSNGMILYLIGRRKYPIINMPETDHKEIETRKKIIGVGLIFLAIGAIGLVVFITTM